MHKKHKSQNDEEFWYAKAKHEMLSGVCNSIKKVEINPSENLEKFYLNLVCSLESSQYEWGALGNWPDYIHFERWQYVLKYIYKLIPEKNLNKSLREIEQRNMKKVFLSYSSSDKPVVKRSVSNSKIEE